MTIGPGVSQTISPRLTMGAMLDPEVRVLLIVMVDHHLARYGRVTLVCTTPNNTDKRKLAPAK